MVFADRVDAGRRLAARLGHLRGEPVVVLGLPRGGVPVAFEVAAALGAPLDVIVVRKLGVPFQPELGMGAIGEDGARIINDEIVRLAGVTDRQLAEVESRERAELERRALRFRGDRPRVPLEGRIAVVVDDGIATGSTARAACQVARAHGAARVVLAVPVAPPGWTARHRPRRRRVRLPGHAGLVLRDRPVLRRLLPDLRRGGREVPAASEPGAGRDDSGAWHNGRCPALRATKRSRSSLGQCTSAGISRCPKEATGVVVFAHGSGSSRHSPRNRYVATVLNQAGLGTLLFDLLTTDEEHDRGNVFDIDLLARRLVDVTRWLRSQPDLERLRIGYFGASTGAAAALWAATEPGADIAAVVSRGGRPDLAAPRLPMVLAPTLLIVGGDDDVVLDLNRQARALLHGARAVSPSIPGATHLFEEPGTLQAAAEAASDWFTRHLAPVPHPAG